MRVRLLCGSILLLLLVARQSAGLSDEPLEHLEIVDQAIAYHGGETYRASETSLEVCSRSGCFQVDSRVEGDSFVHEVSGTFRGERRRVRVTNREILQWREGGEPLAVSPADESRLRDWVMARVYFPFLPYRLNDPAVFKTDLGLEVWGDRQLNRVKVTFTPGSSSDADDEYLYWFDPETGRVEQFAYSFVGDPGGLRFRRGFNYRRIDGILFFDQENLGIEGPELSVDLIDPAYVETMYEVSVVEVKNIRVRPLS